MDILRYQVISILLIFLLFNGNITAQDKTDKKKPVYKINRKIEIPVTFGLFGASILGFEYLRNKPELTYEEVIRLDANDIWKFDRSATQQDASFRHRAHDISDIFLNSSVVLPGILALDNHIRKDWLDLLVLYAESHFINTDIYILGASFTKRIRPFVYNPEVPMKEKLAPETQNSFYSGHVSSAATASFFMAKVYSDYHPEIGNKKYLLYTAALIPPSLVGYYRYKAMKHFPTDLITGLVAGATAGILIPHLHKVKDDDSGLAIVPFAGKFSGLQVSYTFR